MIWKIFDNEDISICNHTIDYDNSMIQEKLSDLNCLKGIKILDSFSTEIFQDILKYLILQNSNKKAVVS